MKQVAVGDIDFEKGAGFVPVVVQDYKMRDVLMVAYANREAIAKTIETGFAHYWSRSRNSIWKKGETSGNTQKIREIRLDCDKDTVLYVVDQTGVACHTGERSCFHNRMI